MLTLRENSPQAGFNSGSTAFFADPLPPRHRGGKFYVIGLFQDFPLALTPIQSLRLVGWVSFSFVCFLEWG